MNNSFNNNNRPILQTNGYNGSEPTRICPHCNTKKPLSEFGYRNMGDANQTIRNQSWCTECRGMYKKGINGKK